MRLDPKSRFTGYVEQVSEAGCWLWKAKIDRHGYGEFWLNGKGVKAHRAAYTFFRGDIPSGNSVLHSCDVRCCVNPSHLFIGTPADNSRDMKEKNRQAKGVDHGRNKLSENDVLSIRKSDLSQKELSRIYGVVSSNISHIKSRRNWNHI